MSDKYVIKKVVDGKAQYFAGFEFNGACLLTGAQCHAIAFPTYAQCRAIAGPIGGAPVHLVPRKAVAPKDAREYHQPVSFEGGDLMTVAEFKQAVQDGDISENDGDGYYVRGGKSCLYSDVFTSPPLDATHVNWFNK